MDADDLTQLSVETLVGPLPYWTRPDPAPSDRPVLLVIASSFMSLRDLNRLPGLLAERCQVALAQLPTAAPHDIPNLESARVAEAFARLAHQAFRRRPMVVLGFADAALVAVQMRAPEILRIIAVEPPLRPQRAWPLRGALQARLESAGPALKRFLADIYGLDGPQIQPRDHRALFAGMQAPADVMVGELPLTPERPVDRMPSLVDDEERAWLRAQPQVRLHVAKGAGHDIAREAPRLVLDVARTAIEGAASFRRPAPQMARRLADAAPWDSRRLLYLGAEAEAFTEAFTARHPQARVACAPPPGETFDAIVLLEPEPQELSQTDLRRLLAPGGSVVACAQLGAPGRRTAEALETQGLTLLAHDRGLTPAGTALVRAGHSPPPATPVTIVAYARTLMDVRTRLPALGLRSAPDLEVEYHAPPFAQPPGDRPRVVVMTRPGTWTAEVWRAAAARAIRARQVLVIEYDDHPQLVHEMTRGGPAPQAVWERFRLVHAVQTSTEPLVELFRQFNPEVALFPNAAFDLAPFRGGERPPAVFFGGVTRGPFVVDVARALGPAIAAHPETAFHVVGDRAFFDALPTANKKFDGYLTYEAYLQAMAACSISLSPLEARPMADTKSDAKYLDASRAGVVTIASPTVYERTIRHGDNGLIARTLEDWPKALAEMLGDAAKRARIAQAAWEDVRDRRMFAHQLGARRDWYRDLLARREALNQALLERSPDLAAAIAAEPVLRPVQDVRTT